MTYCPHCGAQVDPQAEICPKCGVRIKQPPVPAAPKNLWLAVILSAIFPGLGQFYNGQTTKGVLFLVLGIILIFLIFILYLVFWIYNIYDAYSDAKKINAGTLKAA
jgi:TM2 domain-containing membrane protein YozV